MTTEAHHDLDAGRVKRDAKRKLRELHRVRIALWPDRDDATVLSELLSVLSEIRAVENELQA